MELKACSAWQTGKRWVSETAPWVLPPNQEVRFSLQEGRNLQNPGPRSWLRISIGFQDLDQDHRPHRDILWSVRKPGCGALALTWLPGMGTALGDDDGGDAHHLDSGL